MSAKLQSPIKPYGRDWNSDRSAPDYDPQRDPWNPLSPVFGQWPRESWVRNIATSPIAWAFAAWFAVTILLVLLNYIGAITSDTFVVGWVGRYVVLFGAFAVAGIWSVVAWFRTTPRTERGPAYRRLLRRLPGNLAWLAGIVALCLGVDWLEKRQGVPFLVSVGALFVLFFAVTWLWNRARKPTAE